MTELVRLFEEMAMDTTSRFNGAKGKAAAAKNAQLAESYKKVIESQDGKAPMMAIAIHATKMS